MTKSITCLQTAIGLVLQNWGCSLVWGLHHLSEAFRVKVEPVLLHLRFVRAVQAAVGAIRQDFSDEIFQTEELFVVGDDCVLKVEGKEALGAEEAPLVDGVGASVSSPGEVLHGNGSCRICDLILTHEAVFRHFLSVVQQFKWKNKLLLSGLLLRRFHEPVSIVNCSINYFRFRCCVDEDRMKSDDLTCQADSLNSGNAFKLFRRPAMGQPAKMACFSLAVMVVAATYVLYRNSPHPPANGSFEKSVDKTCDSIKVSILQVNLRWFSFVKCVFLQITILQNKLILTLKELISAGRAIQTRNVLFKSKLSELKSYFEKWKFQFFLNGWLDLLLKRLLKQLLFSFSSFLSFFFFFFFFPLFFLFFLFVSIAFRLNT